MKQCPNCHKTYPDNASPFCVEDGTKLVGESTASAAFQPPVMSQYPSTGAVNLSPIASASKFSWLKIIGIAAVVLIGGALLIGITIISIRRDSQQTSETTATVTNISLCSARKGNTQRRIRYAYTVEGTNYQGNQCVGMTTGAGLLSSSKVRICYDPKNPGSARMTNAQCSSPQPTDDDSETTQEADKTSTNQSVRTLAEDLSGKWEVQLSTQKIRITFNRDGTYSEDEEKGSTESGTYSINGETVTFHSPKDGDQKVKIKIEVDSMTFTNEKEMSFPGKRIG